MALEPTDEIDDDPGDTDPEPPAPDRAARRALALLAVAARGLLEQEDPTDPEVESRRSRLLAWADEGGFRAELEPDESRVLQTAVGRLDRQDAINAVWRLEGAAVLAWALRRGDMPAYDGLVMVDELFDALGFLDVGAARTLIADPPLRGAEELEAMRKQFLGLHWRLREFSLRPQAIDFRLFARTAWFGELDLGPFELSGGDLALRGVRIDEAPAEVFRSVLSATMERHQAVNWLCGATPVYSETDTAT